MKITTKELILCSIFAAFISIFAQISVPLPFTTVPLTLQVFAIAMTGIILGSRCGFISVLIYLLLGGIGLPIFSNFSGGIAILVGPTGGYLLGFPLMAFIIGYFREKFNYSNTLIIGLLFGLLIDYTTGTLMFSAISGNTIYQSLVYCVIPFIFTDLLKLALAFIVGSTVYKRVSSYVH